MKLSILGPRLLLCLLTVIGWTNGSLILLRLASYQVPTEIYACDVRDPETGDDADGPTPDCPSVARAARDLGRGSYTQAAGRVYWIDDSVTDSFPPSCLIGLKCLRNSTDTMRNHRIDLIELDGHVDLRKLKGYLGGIYVSDGTTTYYAWRRVPQLQPPFAMSGIRQIGNSDFYGAQYVTDGTWVLFEGRKVEGAVPGELQLISSPPEGNDVDEAMLRPARYIFARDRRSVFCNGESLPSADPRSFELVRIPRSAGDSGGYYAIDRNHVWAMSGSLTQTTPEFAEGLLQRIAEDKARAASKH